MQRKTNEGGYYRGGRGGYQRGSHDGYNEFSQRGGSRGGHNRFSQRGFGRGGRGGFSMNRYGPSVSVKLAELCEKENDEILLPLLDSRVGFLDLLNRSDSVELQELPNIFRVLDKACSSQTSPNLTVKLLQKVLDSSFLTRRIKKFCTVEILSLDREMDSAKAQKLLVDMFSVFLALYVHLESLSYERLFDLICGMQSTLRRMETRGSLCVSTRVRETFNRLNDHVTAIKERQITSRQVDVRFQPIDDRKPPEDFRTLPIQPTLNELLSAGASNVFLRKNINIGGYESVDHYLDVQFRLMREDFIAPLRDGIQDYISEQIHGSAQRGRNTNIRVYSDARVSHPIPADFGIVYLVRFNMDRLRKVRWDISKRFIFGSLLVLTSNNFNSAYFAVVADRNIEDLQRGCIMLRFLADIPPCDVSHVMVESTVYFEAYHHVLLKLQMIDSDPTCFPMVDYIVFCKKDVKVPKYLVRNSGLIYDLSVIAKEPVRNTFDPFNGFHKLSIRPMSSRINWPNKDDLGLDDSQMEALKTSLTKEMVIIQGPPGTGKTYIGLKIVKVLIECVQSQILNFGPILIVCYTNHALDQFLEGILTFLPKDGIVRVGGKSKSEEMKQFSLSSLRKKMIDSRQVPREIFRLMGKLSSDLRFLKQEIIANRKLIEFSFTRITELANRGDFMSPIHQRHLTKNGNRSRNIVRSWLLNQFETEFEQHVESSLYDILDLILHELIAGDVFDVFVEIRQDPMGYDSIMVEDDVTWETERRTLEDDHEFNINDSWRQIMSNSNDDEDIPNFGDGWQMQTKKKQMGNFIRRKLGQKDAMTEAEVDCIRDPWDLDIDDRWKLYRYWMLHYRDQLYEKSKEQEVCYNKLTAEKAELRKEEDLVVMKKSKILGITTTGAARYGHYLPKLHCKIAIIEEAAEVLESHVVASLSSGLEHLILIGDHKQLKPSAAVYKLAKNYGLDLSLFERMFDNKFHCDTLALQHRMRPEIAEIMRFIYERLQNHESVKAFDNIRGISSNVFFFNHSEREEHAAETLSYSNPFEAQLVVALCNHFLCNKYKPYQITILTLYSGQLFVLKNLMPRNRFDGVRVCVVDNYQGEENDIIILSLVRSNEHENIGFLSIENRVCVALSRAKKGLFVLGNFQLLASKNKLWHKIVCDLVHKNQLGDSLLLKCQNHSNDPGIQVSRPEHFKVVPDGGCNKICGQRLKCGHSCPKVCHITDNEHALFMCMKPCGKTCPNGHSCKNKCFEKCSSCSVIVEKIVPSCQHKQNVPCSILVENFNCREKCAKTMKCGHPCTKQCGQMCSHQSTCTYKQQFEFFLCKHSIETFCGVNKSSLLCSKPCLESLSCGHVCQGNCGVCSDGRLHEACKFKCDRLLICGHRCEVACSRPCPPCSLSCNDSCEHKFCGHKCSEPCVPCSEKCKLSCSHMQCLQTCHMKCLQNPCDEPCEKEFLCKSCQKKHMCIGLCGEICPNLCPKCDRQMLDNILTTFDVHVLQNSTRFITLQTCKHTFEVTSLDHLMGVDPKDKKIKRKVCPKCYTPIEFKSCRRYRNVVRDDKNFQKLVNKKYIDISEKLSGKKGALVKKWRDHREDLIFVGTTLNIDYLRQCQTLIDQLNVISTVADANTIVSFESYLNVLLNIKTLLESVIVMQNDIYKKHAIESLKKLIEWLHPDKRCFSISEIRSLRNEIIRIRHIQKFDYAIRKYRPIHSSSWNTETEKLLGYHAYPVHIQEATVKVFEKLRMKENIPDLDMTRHESTTGIRTRPVDFVGCNWLKCEKNHVYHINEGECDQCKLELKSRPYLSTPLSASGIFGTDRVSTSRSPVSTYFSQFVSSRRDTGHTSATPSMALNPRTTNSSYKSPFF